MSGTGAGARIYLDHAATAPVRAEVRAAVEPFLGERFGNPASLHWAGRAARDALERARAQVGALLDPPARPEEIVFTSGGTEANALALRGLLPAARRPHLAVSAIEHSSVLAAARALEREGARVDWLASDRHGVPDLAALDAALAGGAALVSIALGNNEVGTIAPAREIAARCRAAGALFHADAVQAAGWLALALGRDDAPGPDALTLSAHKLGGLQGTGALVVRRGIPLRPMLEGGEQERGLRGGTPATIGIVAFGVAAELAARERVEAGPRATALRRRLEDGILGAVRGAALHGHPEERLPHIASFTFDGAAGELILLNLDLEGVAASAGSACVAGRTEASHVLLAMGLGPEAARGAVRMSLGRDTHPEEIERVLAVLPPIVRRVRAASRES